MQQTDSKIISFLKKKLVKLNAYNKIFLEHIESNKHSIVLYSNDTDIECSIAQYIAYWSLQEENVGKFFIVKTRKSNYNDIVKYFDELCNLLFIRKLSTKVFSGFHIILENGINIMFKTPESNQHEFILRNSEKIGVYMIANSNKYTKVTKKKTEFIEEIEFANKVLSKNHEIKMIITTQVPRDNHHIYKIWRDAEFGKNILAPLRMYFWLNHEMRFDNEWLASKLKKMNTEDFDRFYNLVFVGQHKPLKIDF